MKEYNSNYLGMVIDNNDPEYRGRVQVFIPHIMPALYEGWNKEGLDITINCVGDNMPQGLTSDIVDRLKKILPWAEAASPIVGQSSPGGILPAIAGAITAVGEAAAGAISAAGSLIFDQSPTSIPAGNLPPGSDLKIPVQSVVTTAGLVPAFVQRLNGFYHEATSLGYKIVCSSAYRDPQKQISLYKGSGGYQDSSGKWTGGNGSVARPGGSSHEYGIAVDLKTTGNGVSITNISTARDKSSNKDTPAYRDLLKKYGLHQPLHPDVYNSGVPEKWHVEPIEMPGFGGSRGGKAPQVKERLLASAPSPTEAASASQFPPNASPLTTKSPSNTDLAPPIAPNTNTIPPQLAAPPASSSEPNITLGGSEISGTVSGKGTATTTTGNTQVRGFGKLTSAQAFAITKQAASSAGSPFPEFTATIAAFEGGHLNSSMSKRANNPFGQTVSGSQAAALARGERLKSRPYIIGNTAGADKQGHAVYGSLEDAAKDHLDRWAKEKNCYVPGNPGATANAFVANGYNSEAKGGLPPGQYWKTNILKIYEQLTGTKADPVEPLPVSTLTDQPLPTPEFPAIVGNTDPHGPTVVKNTNDAAKGMFTFPGVGAMVWIFFREGNPLFPVYFAASYSSSEWKSAYGGNSLNPEGTNQGTVGNQVSNSLKLNPNAGGGLEFTHIKNAADPSGSSDKAVAMIYGDDGSNMMFSKGYHQIYTRNDRRDQIDGHLYSIIGGAEEKWIEDDSSVNIKGNVTIKIGKIDAESMNAMQELSDFSKQLNETLMSNSGEQPATPPSEEPPPEEESPATPAAEGEPPPTDAAAADETPATETGTDKPWLNKEETAQPTGPTVKTGTDVSSSSTSTGTSTSSSESVTSKPDLQYTPEAINWRKEQKKKDREQGGSRKFNKADTEPGGKYYYPGP